MGTVAYMAPEQASGETVDHRADIWSFGVVLYEMVTGTRPAPGVRLRVEGTPELERIISKCLEIDRERRYQHASDAADRSRATETRDGPKAGAASTARAPPRAVALDWRRHARRTVDYRCDRRGVVLAAASGIVFDDHGTIARGVAVEVARRRRQLSRAGHRRCGDPQDQPDRRDDRAPDERDPAILDRRPGRVDGGAAVKHRRRARG